LAPGLRAFAESELRLRLAEAAELWRDVEFLLAWPVDGEDGPTLQGRIDLLWREGTGGWHLLAWDADPPVGRDPWQGRKPGLYAQAWAVRQQVGAWPRGMHLFSFARGGAVSAVPREAHAALALRAARGAWVR
jgi:hypothetical protein